MSIKLDELKTSIFGNQFMDYRGYTKINPMVKMPIRDVSSPSSLIDRIVFHCTDANHWKPDKLSQFFVEEKGWPICGYHYYVMGDTVYHMVGENVITYHAAPYNKNSVSFSIDYPATEFEKIGVAPSVEVMDKAIKTATFLALKFKVPTPYIYGHRELQYTGWFWKQDHKVLRKTCPGLKIDLNQFRIDVCRTVQYNLNVLGSNKLATDGIFGPKTALAMKNFIVEL